jgi:ketosteroid isomerase-like protein
MNKFLFAMFLFIASSIALSQDRGMTGALAEMVAAERAFAKLSVEKGIREAFISSFSDDGVNLQPHPVNTKESYGKRPAPAALPPVTLNWSPVYGGVSAAGDMGYSTGPYVFEDRSQPVKTTSHGLFFSVWKRQADGKWKVVLDLGVQADEAVYALDTPFQPAKQSKSQFNANGGELEKQRAEIARLDQKAFPFPSRAAEYLTLADADVRVYQPSFKPFIGRESVRRWLETERQLMKTYSNGETYSVTFRNIKSDVSRSADLGYSYGSYEVKAPNQENVMVKGYYARVWKRDEAGQWRIVFEVDNQLPDDQK